MKCLFRFIPLAFLCGQLCAQADQPPNIVLILADDLGWGDISAHGGGIATPNLDRLFKQGVELRNFTGWCVCSPTRAMLLTGRHPFRVGTGPEVGGQLAKELTAWASDGLDRAATVRVPELGRLTLRARACGNMHRAVLKNGDVSLTQLDEEGSTFTRAPAGQPVTAPADLAADSVPASRNLFAQKYSGQRTDFSGQVGFEFTPAAPLLVTALGRSVSGVALQRAHPVTLWDPATEKPLARVSVSPASKVDEKGFAFERLANPVTLEMGRSYRLTSGEEQGGDPMMDIGDIRAHLAVADVGPGVFAVGDVSEGVNERQTSTMDDDRNHPIPCGTPATQLPRVASVPAFWPPGRNARLVPLLAQLRLVAFCRRMRCHQHTGPRP